jgi:CheY-like chemotaxis protein
MRVLVVDDNASSREILQALLEDMSFEVSVAASAAEGVAELEKEAKGRPYQLVFMDNQMPEMGGFEATRLIREWERGMRNSACDEQFGPELASRRAQPSRMRNEKIELRAEDRGRKTADSGQKTEVRGQKTKTKPPTSNL